MTDTKILAKAVRWVAWGYLLIHMHIKINGFDLLADWGAWILFWKTIQILKEVRPKTVLLERFCIVLGIWSVIQWQSFFELPNWAEPVTLVLRLVRIYFDFQLLTELAYLAGDIPDGGGEWLSKQILGARTAIVVLQTAMILSGMVPASLVEVEILEIWWSGALVLLILLQFAYTLFLMYHLFGLAKNLEQMAPLELKNENK